MAVQSYFDIKAISASSLKWFEQSPLYFRKMLDKEIEQAPQRFFEFGTQAHMKILEPERFEKEYCTLDFKTPSSEQQKKFCEDYVSFPAKKVEDKAVYAYKNNYVSKESDDKIKEKAVKLKEQLHDYIQYLKKRTEVKDVLNRSTWAKLEDINNLVHNHIKAKELLFSDISENIFVANEFEIMWEFPTKGLPCKSAIDRLIIDHNTKTIKLVDIKTTSNIAEFKQRFQELKYSRQMAFYWMAIAWYFKNTLNRDDFFEYTQETYIVCIGKGDLQEVKVYELTIDTLNEGYDSMLKLIEELEWHWKNELWEHSRDYYTGNYMEKL